MHAKKIKNKPQVNRTVSEQTTIHRLEREIRALKAQLEERDKDSDKIKIQNKILFEQSKLIDSCSLRHKDVNRRRTWCPTTTSTECIEGKFLMPKNEEIPKSHIPVLRTPFINFSRSNGTSPVNEVDDENFTPAEVFNFEVPVIRSESPANDAEGSTIRATTPTFTEERPKLFASLTPDSKEKK